MNYQEIQAKLEQDLAKTRQNLAQTQAQIKSAQDQANAYERYELKLQGGLETLNLLNQNNNTELDTKIPLIE